MKRQDIFFLGALLFFTASLITLLTVLLIADTCPRPPGCMFSNTDCWMDPGTANNALILQGFCPVDLAYWGTIFLAFLVPCVILAFACFADKKK